MRRTRVGGKGGALVQPAQVWAGRRPIDEKEPDQSDIPIASTDIQVLFSNVFYKMILCLPMYIFHWRNRDVVI
jgi:hypothetical protein